VSKDLFREERWPSGEISVLGRDKPSKPPAEFRAFPGKMTDDEEVSRLFSAGKREDIFTDETRCSICVRRAFLLLVFEIVSVLAGTPPAWLRRERYPEVFIDCILTQD
jgi:hypothetical protein